jgi:hypothetical protein
MEEKCRGSNIKYIEKKKKKKKKKRWGKEE